MKTNLIASALVLSASVAAARPSFVVPEQLYAVPNVTCDVNLVQLFDSYTPNRYVLEALSPVGRCYENCWQFVPKVADAGKIYPLILNAWDDEHGLVASATTSVRVATGVPVASLAKRRFALSLLAASDTGSRYQDQLRRQMWKYGYANYAAVGSHSGGSESMVCEPEKDAPHDGYGGFAWEDFLHRYLLSLDELDNIQEEGEREVLQKRGYKIPKGQEWRRALLKSPMLRLEGTKPVVDIQGWFDRINGGKAPDIFLVCLGGNGVFIQRPDKDSWRVQHELDSAKELVATLRKYAPNALIAIASSPFGGSLDQDSWGKNYGAIQHCAIAHRSFLDYNRTMMEFCRSFKDGRVVYVSTMQAIHPVRSYYTGRTDGNALHPRAIGGVQLGDAIFAWLVNWLETSDL